MRYLLLIVSLASILVLAGCGGGNGGPRTPLGGEDPAAQSINFTVLSKTSAFAGRVRITGVVKNVGGQDYKSSVGGPKATVELFEDSTVVAVIYFSDLAVQAQTELSYERDWNAASTGQGEIPPIYKLRITYDPDLRLDTNPDNDDVDDANNEITLSGQGVNVLMMQ